LAVDHCGFEGTMTPADLEGATARLLRLAVLPNVVVKASALPAFVVDEFPFPALHAPLRSIVEEFGPERVFWGSDMTRLSCTYAEAARFTRHVNGLSATDLDWLMGRGIERWLGWDGP
jgi:predicted TIM-barrel fold metal-dependent hydrolase